MSDFTVIDIETTGSEPWRHELVSVGIGRNVWPASGHLASGSGGLREEARLMNSDITFTVDLTGRVLALAWAAGLFEGEGSISVHTATKKGHTYRRLCLGLGSTDEDVVRRFQAAIGEGNVNGPYGPYPGSHKPCWRWQVTGAKAEAVLDRLLPYLGQRRTAKAEEVRHACA